MTEHKDRDIGAVLLKHLWLVPLVVVPILFLLNSAGVAIPLIVYIFLGIVFIAIFIRSLFQNRPEDIYPTKPKPEDNESKPG